MNIYDITIIVLVFVLIVISIIGINIIKKSNQNHPLKSKEVTSNLPGIDNKDVKPSNPQLVKETI